MSETTRKPAAGRLLRRSVALPHQLVADVLACAPPELAHNLNQIVAASLREFVVRRKALAFDEAMRQMAADPEIQSASAAITAEFTTADMDGLRG